MSEIIDWEEVERFIEERKPLEVSAGILNDWYYTAATVYINGEWTDKSKAFVTSTWATPGFKAEMPNGDTIEVECHRKMTDKDIAEWKEKSAENKRQLKEIAKKLKDDRNLAL